MTREKIYLFDTTLRDGQQTPGIDFSVEDKIAIATMLDEFGLDYVEGGYPGANPTDTAFFSEKRTRQARFVAMAIGADKALVAQLMEAYKLFGQLQDKLKEARKGGDVEELKSTVYPLGRLSVTFKKHAILKDLFPLGEDLAFPEEEEDDD